MLPTEEHVRHLLQAVTCCCRLLHAVASSRNKRLQAVAMLAVYTACRRAGVSYGQQRKKKQIPASTLLAVAGTSHAAQFEDTYAAHEDTNTAA